MTFMVTKATKQIQRKKKSANMYNVCVYVYVLVHFLNGFSQFLVSPPQKNTKINLEKTHAYTNTYPLQTQQTFCIKSYAKKMLSSRIFICKTVINFP